MYVFFCYAEVFRKRSEVFDAFSDIIACVLLWNTFTTSDSGCVLSFSAWSGNDPVFPISSELLGFADGCKCRKVNVIKLEPVYFYVGRF